MDRAGMAELLRHRRESLQPEDVGLERGARRRRAPGLRREEAAALCRMSADYLSRLEQQRGPHPSERMLSAIATGLRMSVDERDLLFVLGGYAPPPPGAGRGHVDVGLGTVFDRLHDLPAQIVTGLGETIGQTPLAAALLDDQLPHRGPARSYTYRWFTRPETRARVAVEDHALVGRALAAVLRRSAAATGAGSDAEALARHLATESAEFSALWSEATPRLPGTRRLRVEHPVVGRVEVRCQPLVDAALDHYLLVYTATPGSESAARLRALAPPAAS
ncbi:helix-turn-helix transcriptional regulator [Agromyces terreus]|uniref:helix-turn-helix transcriptional regulator n=1 Tax=Agromyces terreus TaxID=424795 RepID=UPI0031D3EA14